MLPGSALKASRFGCTTSLIKSLGLISDVPAEGVRVLGGSCQRNSEVSLKANVRKWHIFALSNQVHRNGLGSVDAGQAWAKSDPSRPHGPGAPWVSCQRNLGEDLGCQQSRKSAF